jgi:hypothetical protein
MQTDYAKDITRYINTGVRHKQQVNQWMQEVKGTSISTSKNIR